MEPFLVRHISAIRFVGRALGERIFLPNVNKSETWTFKASANFSNPATDGAFTPLSTRLMNSTEQPTFFASSGWVNWRVFRSSAIRRPSFFSSMDLKYHTREPEATERGYG